MTFPTKREPRDFAQDKRDLDDFAAGRSQKLYLAMFTARPRLARRYRCVIGPPGSLLFPIRAAFVFRLGGVFRGAKLLARRGLRLRHFAPIQGEVKISGSVPC
jgi:hypothetical protein